LTFAAVAVAEPTSADKSLATQLFKEGRTLVDQGKYAEGCRSSRRANGSTQAAERCSTSPSATKRRDGPPRRGPVYGEALGIARKDDGPQRAEMAQQHIEALEPTLSRLIVRAGRFRSPDLEIKRDGTAIRRAAWGTAMPVDPGDHVIEAFALGKIPWKQTITVGGKAETKTIAVPVLDNAPVAPTPTASTSGGHMPATFVEVRKPVSPAVWVAYGIGAVGVGVGTYFGLRAMSEQQTADDNCPQNQCSSAGSTANANAIQAANISTVGFGVGVLGIGLGTFLLLSRGSMTMPSSSVATSSWFAPRAIALDVDGRELTVRGAW
jgi:hypothetical protein